MNFHRVKNLPSGPLEKGDVYWVEVPGSDSFVNEYKVDNLGRARFVRGISDGQNERLEQLTQSLLNKIKDDYSKQQLDRIIQGLEDDINDIVVGSSAGLVRIDSTDLPTPETDNNYAVVGDGVYTRAGQPDVVVPEGSLGVLSWDGNIWELSSEVSVPVYDIDSDLELDSSDIVLDVDGYINVGEIFSDGTNGSNENRRSVVDLPVSAYVGKTLFIDGVANGGKNVVYRDDSNQVIQADRQVNFPYSRIVPAGSTKVSFTIKYDPSDTYDDMVVKITQELLIEQVVGVKNKKIQASSLTADNNTPIPESVENAVPLGYFQANAVQKKDVRSYVTHGGLAPINSEAIYSYMEYRYIPIGTEIDLRKVDVTPTPGQPVMTYIYPDGREGDRYLESLEINALKTGDFIIGVFKEDFAGTYYPISKSVVKIGKVGISKITELEGLPDIKIEDGQVIGFLQDESMCYVSIKRADTVDPPLTDYQKISRAAGDVEDLTEFADFPNYLMGVRFNTVLDNAGVKFREIDNFIEQNKGIYGSTILALGDSITAEKGSYIEKIYSQGLAKSLYNMALGGATLAWRAGTVETDNPVTTDDTNVVSNQILKFLKGIDEGAYSAPDIIVISALINDVARQHPLGNVDEEFSKDIADVNKRTISGAYRDVVESLLKHFPNASIYILTPLQSTQVARNYNKTLPYVNVLKECAGRTLNPVIDCFLKSQFNRIAQLTTDGLHPNEEGKHVQFKFVYKEILNNYLG